MRDPWPRTAGRRRDLARRGDARALERGRLWHARHDLAGSMPAVLTRRWGRPLVLLALIGVLSLVEQQPMARPTHTAEWLQAGDVQVRAVPLGAVDTTLVLLHGYGESLMAWRATADRFGQ